MIFISGVMSITIQKNTLCTNKIRVIHFCLNFLKFLPENVHFLIFWGTTGPCPPPPARAPMKISFGGSLAEDNFRIDLY